VNHVFKTKYFITVHWLGCLCNISFEKKHPLKMVTKRDRNMYEVYNGDNVINSHVFICSCWFYSHSEASVHGHEIFKNGDYTFELQCNNIRK
jgi:hypothetical protein